MNPALFAKLLQILPSRLGGGEHYTPSNNGSDGAPSEAPPSSWELSNVSTGKTVDRPWFIVDSGPIALTEDGWKFFLIAGPFMAVGVSAIVVSAIRRAGLMSRIPDLITSVGALVWCFAWIISLWIVSSWGTLWILWGFTAFGVLVTLYGLAKNIAYALPGMENRPVFRKPMMWMSWALGSDRKFLDPLEDDHAVEEIIVFVFHWPLGLLRFALDRIDPARSLRNRHRWFGLVSKWLDERFDPPWKRMPREAKEANPAKEIAPPKDFDARKFISRIPVAWKILQESWTQQDLSEIRNLMSDGLYERLAIQAKFLKRRGMADAVILGSRLRVQLVDFRRGQAFSALTVRLSALVRDKDIDLATGLPIPEREISGPMVEYWTFVKSGDPNIAPAKGAESKCCPKCGAQIAGTESGLCPACGGWLRSAVHDWVLTEISQIGEWRPSSAKSIPGAESIASTDPQFDPLNLEDRVSAIFWRTVDAINRRDIASASRFASPSMVAKLQEWRDSFKKAEVFLEPLVGSLDLKRIRTGQGKVFADIEIGWQAGPDSIWPFATEEFRKRRNVSKWTLVRPLEARSHEHKSFASGSCSSCGAPDTNAKDGLCTHCGNPVDVTELDWHLHLIESGFSTLGI